MKPCILLFTTCYIICGIYGVWQNNGRGLIFRDLGGRTGQFLFRGKNSVREYNGDKPPAVIKVSDTEDGLDEEQNVSATEYHALAPQIYAMGPNKELANGGLTGSEDKGYVNYPMLNNKEDLESNEMHSSEEDHDFNSNSFNIVGATNNDGTYDKKQNVTGGNTYFEMNSNTDVNFREGSQLNHGLQSNVNENGGAYFYPQHNKGGGFDSEETKNEGYECNCKIKSNSSPIVAQGKKVHKLYNERQVNKSDVLNSIIMNDGSYNIGSTGITSRYYNLPVQNNRIHGLYPEWTDNRGSELNKEIQGSSIFNKQVQGTYGPNVGEQGGAHIINKHNNWVNRLYAVGDPKLSGDGGSFSNGEASGSYFKYPLQYNATHGPYYNEGKYFYENGYKGRHINTEVQGGGNIAGQHYSFPIQDNMIQGFNKVGQTGKPSLNIKGSNIVNHKDNILVHGHSFADIADHYTEGQPTENGGLNVETQHGGVHIFNKDGNSMMNSYKLPVKTDKEDGVNAGKQNYKNSINIVAQDNKGLYNLDEKVLSIQEHPMNLNKPGSNLNSNLNHASQGFIINEKQINKGASPYFKIQENGEGGYYLIPFSVPSCSCQHRAETTIDNIVGQPKHTNYLNGEIKDNGKSNLEISSQVNIESGLQSDGNIQKNLAGDKKTGKLSYFKDNDVQSKTEGNTKETKGYLDELNNFKENKMGQSSLNSQVSSGSFSNVKGIIEQENLINDINAVGLDYLERGINDNLHRGISNFAGGVNAGGIGDSGWNGRFSNFGDEVIPSWYGNIGGGFTNVVGLNIGGGTFGGSGYIHGMNRQEDVLNNGAHTGGGLLNQYNKIDALNSENLGHLKHRLYIVKNNNDDNRDQLYDSDKSKYFTGVHSSNKKKNVGVKFNKNGLDLSMPWFKNYLENKKLKGDMNENKEWGIVNRIQSSDSSDKLDYSDTESINEFKSIGGKFDNNKIGLATPWYQNKAGNKSRIGGTKAATKWGVKPYVINGDWLNNFDRIGYYKRGYKFPKLGYIGKRIIANGFSPGYFGR